MKHSDTPDWIRRACALWGHQKRRIWAGRDWHGNIDGYAQSLLGRIREERDGAFTSEVRQYWPEVFTGDGLDVQRAILQRQMKERPRIVATFHYVWDPDWQVPAQKKADLIGIARSTYFKDLTGFHEKVQRFMESDSQSDSSAREIIVEMITQELQRAVTPDISRNLPELALNALGRPALKLSKT